MIAGIVTTQNPANTAMNTAIRGRFRRSTLVAGAHDERVGEHPEAERREDDRQEVIPIAQSGHAIGDQHNAGDHLATAWNQISVPPASISGTRPAATATAQKPSMPAPIRIGTILRYQSLKHIPRILGVRYVRG